MRVRESGGACTCVFSRARMGAQILASVHLLVRSNKTAKNDLNFGNKGYNRKEHLKRSRMAQISAS